MGFHNIDFTVPVSHCLGFCKVEQDFVALADLKDGGTKSLKRRIVAITEGVHNGIMFRGAEIEKMVELAHKTKGDQEFFKIPVVLDHSDRFLDKVGATNAVQFANDPDTGIPAAILDVEFFAGTQLFDETIARVKADPDNTFFSVRVRGDYRKDENGEYLAELNQIHIAVVNEPADQNARIIGELSKEKSQSSDIDLNRKQEDITNMGDDTTTQELQSKVDELTKANAELAASNAENGDKVLLMSEILATDAAIDKDFLKSMDKEQLSQYKAELERTATDAAKADADAAEKKSTEKSLAGDNAGDKTPEDYAKAAFPGLFEEA